MAKTADKKKKSAKGGGSIWPRLTVILVITIGLVIVFPATVLIFAAGMTPTLVARVVDTAPRKYATLTVGYMNIAGCIMVALEMWMSGDSSWTKALSLLGDPLNWFIMFAAAGAGWGLYYSIPPVVASYMTVTSESKLKALTEKQQKLIREWGQEVKDQAPEIPTELVVAAQAVRSGDAQNADKAKAEDEKKAASGDQDKNAEQEKAS